MCDDNRLVESTRGFFSRRILWTLLLSLFTFGAQAVAQQQQQQPEQQEQPECDVVPDLKAVGKTVQNVKPDADSLWAPPGSWDIVYEQSYADSKNLLVIKQDPQPGTGLTAGQLMHLYVDGSGGFVWYKDPRILWGIIAIEFVVIIVLVIRCRGGGGLAGSKTA